MSMVLDEGGIGEIMTLLGTDITWRIAPGSIKTMFTGVQAQIEMDIKVFDTKAVAANFKIPAEAVKLLPPPLFTDSINFLAMIEKYIPKVTLPKFLSQAPTGSVTIGTISTECSKETADFGMTLLGVTLDSLKPADVQKALATAANKEIALVKGNLGMPDCTKMSDVISTPAIVGPPKFPGGKTTAAAICLFEVAHPSTWEVHTDEFGAAAGVKITGTTSAGADMNAGGSNAYLSKMIAAGTLDVSSLGKGATVDKDTSGISCCSDADAKAAPTGGCGPAGVQCTSGPAPGPAPGPSPGPGGSGSGGSNVGKDVGIAVGSLFLVGAGAALFMKHKKKKSEKEELLGAQYTAHTDGQ